MKFKNFFDIDRLHEVLSTLATNKSRSLLTAFGVFWGVFMLVLLMGGGKGLEGLMMSNFNNFAQSSCVIGTRSTTEAYKGFNKGRSWNFTLADVDALKRNVPGIAYASPMLPRDADKVTYGSHSVNWPGVKGVTPEYAHIEVPQIVYGRYINDNDIRLRRRVCVIGWRLYKELFPEGGNPCGKVVEAGGVHYRIVGVDGHRIPNGIGRPNTYSLQVPYSFVSVLFNTGNTVPVIAVNSRDGVTIVSIENQIKSLLKRRHDVHPKDDKALEYFNVEIIFRMFDNLFRGINILVWLIGIGTLLSGAIGVSNIMLVAIRERTVEIGIRRAIGATPADIISQIFCESFIITIFAGLSGIVLAVVALGAAEPMIRDASGLDAPFQVSFGIAVGATVVLGLLGVLAGIAPAMRALSIKPVDAMRDE